MKQSGKTRFIKWLVLYALWFVVGVALGAWMFRAAERSGDAMPHGALMSIVLFLALMAGFFLQTIVHEAGHMVFGLLTGYRFISYRVLSWIWVREGERVHLRRFRLPGTLGQCLMGPPEGYADGADAPYALYHLGGVFFNLIFSAAILLLLPALPGGIAKVICTGAAMAGLLLAISNGIPNEPGKLNNDGRNLLELRRSPATRRAMLQQLEIVAEQNRGLRLYEMPDALFEADADAARKDMISATILVYRANRALDEMDFSAAAEQIDALLADETIPAAQLHCQLLRLDRLYIRAVLGEEITLTKKDERTMKQMRTMLSVHRTAFALARREGDSNRAREAQHAFDKIAARYPYGAEVASERALMDYAESEIA